MLIKNELVRVRDGAMVAAWITDPERGIDWAPVGLTASGQWIDNSGAEWGPCILSSWPADIPKRHAMPNEEYLEALEEMMNAGSNTSGAFGSPRGSS